MNTMLRKLLVVLAIVGWASAAPAEVLFTETFSYPNGHLASSFVHGPGVSGGLWTVDQEIYLSMPIDVLNGALSMKEIAQTAHPPNAQDVFRSFPALGAGQRIYAGFDVSASRTSRTYSIARFRQDYYSSNDRNHLLITSFSGGDFTLGIGGNTPTVTWPSGLMINTTYRVVMSYELDTGNSSLWVDPVNSTSPKISFTDNASTAVTSFEFYQSHGYFGTNQGQVIDNLVVGTRFRDVLAIPTPPLAGDYDGSGTVGPEDYDFWRANFGSNNLDADGNGNGTVDAGDYVVWRKTLGAALGSSSSAAGLAAGVPEPSSMLLVAIGLAVIRLVNRRRTVGCSRGRARIVL